MRTLILAAIACAVLAFASCTTPQQTVAYKSFATVENTVLTSYDAYITSVAQGHVRTNDVPAVSHAFNSYQASMQAALLAAGYNWTNLAPADVTALAQAVLNAITTATTKGK